MDDITFGIFAGIFVGLFWALISDIVTELRRIRRIKEFLLEKAYPKDWPPEDYK